MWGLRRPCILVSMGVLELIPSSYRGITKFLGYEELYVDFQLCGGQGP